MYRNRDFYEQNYDFKTGEVNKCYKALCLMQKKGIDLSLIDSLNKDKLLKMALVEEMYDLFFKLISVTECKVDDKVYSRYVIDPFSTTIIHYLRWNLATSLSERYAMNKCYNPDASIETSTSYVVLISQENREKLLDYIFSFDYAKIKSMKLEDINNRNVFFTFVDDSDRDFVMRTEWGCYGAAMVLKDKNITVNKTIMQKNDESGSIQLIIDYASLSDENKVIANKMISDGNAVFNQYQNKDCLEVDVTFSLDETVEQVNEKFCVLLNDFCYQNRLGYQCN